jgi:hypothetical protein
MWFTVIGGLKGRVSAEKSKHDNGPVTVHDDPPLRRHRDSQPATPPRARRQRVDAGGGQGQEQGQVVQKDAGCMLTGGRMEQDSMINGITGHGKRMGVRWQQIGLLKQENIAVEGG